jgi:large subunit ribosomal protein L2
MSQLLKIKNPTTPSLRGAVRVSRSELSNVKPYKPLVSGGKKSSGRDHGRISSGNKGGTWVKTKYRHLAFKRSFVKGDEAIGTVVTLEYDPNRTSFICLVKISEKDFIYILAPDGIKVGDSINFSNQLPTSFSDGSSMPLKNIPDGSMIHAIETTPNGTAKIVRAAGTYAKVLARDSDFVLVELPSKQQKRFDPDCKASLGRVSNPLHNREKIGNAGTNRRKGKRPVVRGSAMNPVDHPLGGGEGKSTSGRQSCNRLGRAIRGKKTRKNKRNIILKR